MQIVADEHADQAFAEAYEQFADEIFRHCYFRCFSRERAKELMQETFMKTWEYISGGKDIDNVRAFLYKAAHNLIIDEARRRKKREVVSFEDMVETGWDIAGEDGRDEGVKFDARQVAQVMAKVDEPYRTALIMRYVDELPPREIADLLGETANVVSVRINRGMNMLRGLVKHYG